MSSETRVVIVGGGMAGARLAQHLGGAAGVSVTVVGEEPHAAYNRVLLAEVLGGQYPPEVIALPRPDSGVTWLSGVRVVRVDRAERSVVCDDGRVLGYDALVLATGSNPVLPPLRGLFPADGGELPEGVHAFRGMDDCLALDAALARAPGGARAVVIGGGLLGVSAARALARRGARVTLAQQAERLMERHLDADASALLDAHLTELGVEVHTECRVRGVLAGQDPDQSAAPSDSRAARAAALAGPGSRDGGSEHPETADDRASAPDTAAVGGGTANGRPDGPGTGARGEAAPTRAADGSGGGSGGGSGVAAGGGDGRRVGGVEGRGKRVVRGVVLADGYELAADIIVLACGVRPRVGLARAAGIELGARGGVRVDDQLRTSDPRIFALGDCAEHDGVLYGLAGAAQEQADVLARVLAGPGSPDQAADLDAGTHAERRPGGHAPGASGGGPSAEARPGAVGSGARAEADLGAPGNGAHAGTELGTPGAAPGGGDGGPRYSGTRALVRLTLGGGAGATGSAAFDLATFGDTTPAPGDDVVQLADATRGAYRKIIVRGDRLRGGILLGDLGSVGTLARTWEGDEPLPAAAPLLHLLTHDAHHGGL
ncbi:FAD-dependent oxidoreductase [Streptomyces sp. B6B3]|uniref:NAD(P)/FAD-dependent oxidoreductase n=1 Tax=Streptomyces sp. B6B3 TaxID=3153570 RepID=UPI00325F6477